MPVRDEPIEFTHVCFKGDTDSIPGKYRMTRIHGELFVEDMDEDHKGWLYPLSALSGVRRSS